jgi:hypothetical protein
VAARRWRTPRPQRSWSRRRGCRAARVRTSDPRRTCVRPRPRRRQTPGRRSRPPSRSASPPTDRPIAPIRSGSTSGRRRRYAIAAFTSASPPQPHEFGSPSLAPSPRRHVLLGAADGDPEALRDRRVREPFGELLEDLALPRRERVDRAVLAIRRQQPRDHLRIERRPAGGDPPQRGDELADVGHAVLEQVAEARGARRGRAWPRRARRAGRERRSPSPAAARGRPGPRADLRRCGSAACGCR